jgi:peptidoglycan/LPS O-acetylase OafA/YrhL
MQQPSAGESRLNRGWPSRFELIDGARGLAALVVVLSHSGVLPGAGRYAVMAFFVISGYCIAASAQSCRRNNMSFRSFMYRRLHRIYPPYFFAIVFFVLTRLVKAGTGGHNDLDRPWLDWVMNLTMTQWLYLLWHPLAEATQNPKLLVAAFWSLNYEDQFYLVMAAALLLAVRKHVAMWIPVALLSAAGLLWITAWPGPWVTGLFIEYWSHFALGALLYYVLCLSANTNVRIAFAAGVTVLTAWCLYRILPWTDTTVVDQRAFVELGVSCAVTLGLLALRPISAVVSRQLLWKPVAALGTISYSLYLVHQFNLNIVTTGADKLVPPGWPIARITVVILLHLTIASIFWYVCERPFLNRRGKHENHCAPGDHLHSSDPVLRPDLQGTR